MIILTPNQFEKLLTKEWVHRQEIISRIYPDNLVAGEAYIHSYYGDFGIIYSEEYDYFLGQKDKLIRRYKLPCAALTKVRFTIRDENETFLSSGEILNMLPDHFKTVDYFR